MRRVAGKIEMKLMFRMLSRERKMSKRIAENVQACCKKTNGIGREWQKSKSFSMEKKVKLLKKIWIFQQNNEILVILVQDIPLCLTALHLSQYLTNVMHKICFTISFISCLYMLRAHVLEACRGMK